MRLTAWSELYRQFTAEVSASLEFVEEGVIESEKTLLLDCAADTTRVYDIGTGVGRVPGFLKQQGYRGEIHGIDANENMIAQTAIVADNRTFFHHADALDWLRHAESADLIICMGNTMGGFIDEAYRHEVFRMMGVRLSENGHLIVDYRDRAVAYSEDVVIDFEPQAEGDLIVTAESHNERIVRLCQFYPDRQRMFEQLSQSGLQRIFTKDLSGARYRREASVFRGQSA